MKFLALLFSTFLLLTLVNPIFAKQEVISDKDGDFADPDHPGVRVRVFVHNPKSAISNPVLSCTDGDSTALIGPTGWKLPSGNWTYNLNPSSTPSGVGSANFTTIVSTGFGVWSNALASASARPNFVRGSDTTVNKQSYDGKNVIAFGRTSGSALAVTYTRYYPSTGLVVDVDTIFNLKFAWSWTNPSSNSCSLNANTYDAQNILTHELGHWLGLNDHYTSAYVDNTMYGYGAKGEVKKDTLTNGDISGARNIYP